MGHDRLSPPLWIGASLLSDRLELYWTSLCLPVEPCRPARLGSLQHLIGQESLSHGPGLSQARGNCSDTCCKSTVQTFQTRAVNQQARTMTPGEAETLLSVNTHHNSRLLNLHLNTQKQGFGLKGSECSTLSWKSWAKLKKLHYLICTKSVLCERWMQCEECCFRNTRLSIRNSHSILMFFSILETQRSPSNSCDRWGILVNRIYAEKREQSIF